MLPHADLFWQASNAVCRGLNGGCFLPFSVQDACRAFCFRQRVALQLIFLPGRPVLIRRGSSRGRPLSFLKPAHLVQVAALRSALAVRGDCAVIEQSLDFFWIVFFAGSMKRLPQLCRVCGVHADHVAPNGGRCQRLLACRGFVDASCFLRCDGMYSGQSRACRTASIYLAGGLSHGIIISIGGYTQLLHGAGKTEFLIPGA